MHYRLIENPYPDEGEGGGLGKGEGSSFASALKKSRGYEMAAKCDYIDFTLD